MHPAKAQFPISHVKMVSPGKQLGVKVDAFGETDQERSVSHAQDVHDTRIENAYNGGPDPIKIDSGKK